ncbi:hypothetical protein Y1Q_0021273 [Alligator mississippiensis]|uniref:Uncharacterized protein n=1 Tax=Alligator mississippiensis TaxID=8496 RepID=A0A151MS65_ALLMI|nr:hypothetical protein Y1Q_0021273 [Alligator mississippiensis]
MPPGAKLSVRWNCSVLSFKNLLPHLDDPKAVISTPRDWIHQQSSLLHLFAGSIQDNVRHAVFLSNKNNETSYMQE